MLKLIAFLMCLFLAAPAWAQKTTLEFSPSETTISDNQKTQLQSEIIPKLKTTSYTALQVNSYVRSQNQTSPARRLSLTRALALREYLMTQGIPKERMYLHPLGNTTPTNGTQTDVITLKIIKQ